MADSVAVSFEYRVEDFISASRWVVARSPRTYLICGCIAALFLLVGLLIWWYADQAMGQTFMIASLAGGLLAYPLLLVGVTAHTRKSFDANPAFRHEFHWMLSPTEVTINGKGLSATLELANFQRVAETPFGFVLWQAAGIYNFLPTRALPDHDTLVRVREILRQGMPGNARVQLRSN